MLLIKALGLPGSLLETSQTKHHEQNCHLGCRLPPCSRVVIERSIMYLPPRILAVQHLIERLVPEAKPEEIRTMLSLDTITKYI